MIMQSHPRVVYKLKFQRVMCLWLWISGPLGVVLADQWRLSMKKPVP